MADMHPYLAIELPGFRPFGSGTWTNDCGDVLRVGVLRSLDGQIECNQRTTGSTT